MAQAIKTVERPAPPLKMTYEEFLEADFGEQRVEWVNGEVSYMGTVSREHSYLGSFLIALFRFFIEAYQLGFVFFEPFNMKTGPTLPGRNPDILFVTNENQSRIKKNYLEGPADLVVEIISPDDPKRDRVDKREEYEKGGVREYWMIDRENRQADFLVRGEDGLFHPVPVGEGGIFRSTVLAGLWIKVDWLWQEPLPSLMSVLKEWELI